MSDYAIEVKDVSKMYKLFDSNLDRVKDSLNLGRKKVYQEHFALHHLNLQINKGETVGIIGTNGAGKSTLLKIITGVVNPTEGEILIDGRISALLELGAGFNMEYTGIENIYLNGTMMGFTKEEIDARLPEILEFADIGDFVYQPVKMYSSGMFVRLAFAVAINIDPEILIVDEALSVGDVFFQSKCYKKFEDFKKMGKTILFVSHDLGSISRYCDRVILLDKGHKLAEGIPRDMIDLYKKVLVHQVDVDAIIKGQEEENFINSSQQDQDEKVADVIRNATQSVGGTALEHNREDKSWQSYFKINPNLNEYGNGVANIIDFKVEDEKGNLTSAIEKGTEFTITSKVKFHSDVENPIFTYTFRNVQGTAITGTNTMYEQAEVKPAKSGDCYIASFRQRMNLQGGEYLLSISCTGYENGDFVVYHRLYDLLNISVISHKDTVGFYDMDSEVSVSKISE
ncbi:MAG: ABC transporter ATP-binding protein [Lachnospiraceae bacterium]|nr:ABC transporter ATP-binding protein [Lachnospiraceae bacterium]